MIWNGAVGRRCDAPTTHVVTLIGHDGEGVSVAGRFPPFKMCEGCANSVQPLHPDIAVVVRPLSLYAPEAGKERKAPEGRCPACEYSTSVNRANPSHDLDALAGLSDEARAEIDAFRDHLERHRTASAPDCRFCEVREVRA